MSSIEPFTSPTSNNQDVELNFNELSLVRWEELALTLEEHYHAVELWNKRPDGLPMGHR